MNVKYEYREYEPGDVDFYQYHKPSCVGKIIHKIWYDSNGDYHREGAPAVITKDCCEGMASTIFHWYRHGSRHREGAPSSIYRSHKKDQEGYYDAYLEMWQRNGIFHREDGPAYIATQKKDWRKEDWYINGEKFDIDQLAKFMALPIEEQVAIKLLK